jgi:hypothetical protein
VRSGRALRVLAVVCATLSCGEDAVAPPRAATVRVVAGDDVTAVVGTLVTVAVRVEDAGGQGVGNVSVAWAVTSGNGSVNSATATTNSAGEATIGWTLGTTPGPNSLTGTVAGLASVTLAATATVGTPASLMVVSGDQQSAGPGDELPLPVVVRVRDAYGNGVPGVAVNLSSLSGSFVPPIARTNESGEASARWMLGLFEGPHSAVASLQGPAQGIRVGMTATGVLIPLQNNVRISVSGTAGTKRHYKFLLPDNRSLGVTVTRGANPWGVSVYARHNTWPIAFQVNCTLTCGSSGPPGDWYITVIGHTDYDNVTLRTNHYDGNTAGILDLYIGGLPRTAEAAVTLTGPDNLMEQMPRSERLRGATAGTYVLSSALVFHENAAYAPREASQTATVVAQAFQPVSVIYERIPALSHGVPVTLSGDAGSKRYYVLNVPAGVTRLTVTTATGTGNADLRVRRGAPPEAPGPNDCASLTPSVAESCSIDNPAAGDWYIMVEGVTAYSTVLNAGYTTASGGINLRIDAVHLNQANQTLHGSIGGVSGRPGLLRVVASADAANVLAVPVRVRLYQGTTLLREVRIPAPRVGVPVSPDITALDQTWNLPLSAEEVVPGLAVEAVLDPDNTVVTGDAALKRFPRNDGPASLDVGALPPLRVLFVPIIASTNGTTGAVTQGNMGAYLEDVRRWLPAAQIVPAMRQPYTTTTDLVASGWPLLSELRAVSIADGATDQYYVGIFGSVPNMEFRGGTVVPDSPNSTLRVALSDDALPQASWIVAHELGHLLGYGHSPCGTPGDPAYPHANGRLGSPGFDIVSGQLRHPLQHGDFMGACLPMWVSDYTYDQMLVWRRADTVGALTGNPAVIAAVRSDTDRTSGLLLWGTMSADRITLNPAFALTTRPVLPARPGTNTLRGFAGDGSRVFELSFDAERLFDGPDAQARQFAFFVPLAPSQIELVARIDLVTPQGTTSRSARSGPETQDRVSFDESTDGMRVRWDGARYPMALVRDRTTGQVLSIGRLGGAQLGARGYRSDQLEVVASDGVRTRVLPH